MADEIVQYVMDNSHMDKFTEEYGIAQIVSIMHLIRVIMERHPQAHLADGLFPFLLRFFTVDYLKSVLAADNNLIDIVSEVSIIMYNWTKNNLPQVTSVGGTAFIRTLERIVYLIPAKHDRMFQVLYNTARTVLRFVKHGPELLKSMKEGAIKQMQQIPLTPAAKVEVRLFLLHLSRHVTSRHHSRCYM